VAALIDTTIAAQLLYFAPGQWASYRRSRIYDEGWLLWLDADTQIRQAHQRSESMTTSATSSTAERAAGRC